jgi:transcriptional regulator with XRE-family HTH domain
MAQPTFGKLLRSYRLRARKTQEELANAIGVDFTYISKIENDKAAPPSRRRIERAARFLQLTQDEEIGLLLAAEKLPSDVQDWALDRPKAVSLYRTIKQASPEQQEEILDDLIEEVRRRLGEGEER